MHGLRKSAVALATALALCVTAAPAVAHDPVPPTPPHPSASAFDNRVVKQIDVNNIMGHISYLSETIGPRPAGSAAELETVEYLVSQLESYGYKNVEVQEFLRPRQAAPNYNVIATKMPQNRNWDNGQIIVIGSHHDSVRVSPGANDDATGVAASLELARIFANTPTAAEVRFVFFGAEENGLVGARQYVNALSADEIERMVAMFQLDMIGSRDAGHLTMFTVDGNQNTVTDLAAAAGARVSMNEIPPFSRLGRSDHVPFYEAGIPAALFIHTPLEPWYHTANDTIENISPDKVYDVTRMIGAAVFHGARKETPALVRSQVAPQPVDYYYEAPHL